MVWAGCFPLDTIVRFPLTPDHQPVNSVQWTRYTPREKLKIHHSPLSKMKLISSILLLIALASCQQDIIDISNLTQDHQIQFRQAAIKAGVQTTTNTNPLHWKVIYSHSMTHPALAQYNHLIQYCLIRINPSLILCNGQPQLQSIAEHELRHCQGEGHSDDPTSIMYYKVNCDD